MRAWFVLILTLALWPASTGCALPIIGARASSEPASQASAHRPKRQRRHAAEPVARRPQRKAAARPEPVRTARSAPPKSTPFALSLARPMPGGRGPLTCYDQLAAAGIDFEQVPREDASGIRYPTRLIGPIGGVEIRQHAVKPGTHTPERTVLDCRLALSILDWAKVLRRAGVRGIEHYSTYRPGARVGGRGKSSGHAHGLALDAARFHLDDGSVVDVLTDWESRSGDPCPRRSDEAWPSRLLRSVVCEAIDDKLFQVVITPHHDAAHENHVHLELRPDVDWTYVR